MTLHLFIGILALGMANPIIFRLRNSGGQRYRYRY